MGIERPKGAIVPSFGELAIGIGGLICVRSVYRNRV